MIRSRYIAIVEQFNARKFRQALLPCVFLSDIAEFDTKTHVADGQMFEAGRWTDHLRVGEVICFEASRDGVKLARPTNVLVMRRSDGQPMAEFRKEIDQLNAETNIPRDVVKILNRIEHRLKPIFSHDETGTQLENVMAVVRKVLQTR